jgi:transposase
MKYMMSAGELEKLSLIKGAIDGVYTVREAAKRLKLSGRHIKRLKRRVREEGDGAVIHGNSGKHPANYTDEELRSSIIALKKTALYEGANFTYFRELLEERENISISYAALCRILKGAGMMPKRKHRDSGKTFARRKRRGRGRGTVAGGCDPLRLVRRRGPVGASRLY